jgi:glycosyltransferase involved in cell wall biosynthesis
MIVTRNTDENNPLISIIMVCLNSRKTVERAIQSVIDLEYPNIEFIVIDGESTDGTIDVLNKYGDYIDSLVVEMDKGVYDAMNKGTKIANGDFFYFVGADDIIINSWHHLIGRLKSQDTIYYGNTYFPVSNRVYDGRFSKIKLLTRNICQQAVFYPRVVFEKYHFSEAYPLWADFHFNLILNSDPDFKFKYINILIAVFSEKGISTTKTDTKFMDDRLNIIKEKYSFILYIYCLARTTLRRLLKR